MVQGKIHMLRIVIYPRNIVVLDTLKHKCYHKNMDTASTQNQGRNKTNSKLNQFELHFESIGSIKEERSRLKQQSSEE